MANGIRKGDPRGFNKGRSSVKVPEFNKPLKKAGGHISENVVEIQNFKLLFLFFFFFFCLYSSIYNVYIRGIHSVMINVIGNGHGDVSSIPG